MNGRVIRPARTMIVSAVAWYTMLFAFAQMQDPSGGMMMLMLAGFAQSVCMVTLFVVMLRITSDKFRGRVMGVRMLVIYSLPLGLLAAGALIDLIGFGADGDALCDRGPAVHRGDRGAMACRHLAGADAGQCALTPSQPTASPADGTLIPATTRARRGFRAGLAGLDRRSSSCRIGDLRSVVTRRSAGL